MKQQPRSLVRTARALALKLLAKAVVTHDEVEYEAVEFQEEVAVKGWKVVVHVISEDETVVTPEVESDEESVNVRMGKTIFENHDSYGWTAQQWADFLGCSNTAVKKSRQWKAIMRQRDENRLQREEDQGEI